jgi:ERCC4-related helicase
MEAQSDMAAETAPVVTRPRAYQLELFEASMRRNVIVTVSTGG